MLYEAAAAFVLEDVDQGVVRDGGIVYGMEMLRLSRGVNTGDLVRLLRVRPPSAYVSGCVIDAYRRVLANTTRGDAAFTWVMAEAGRFAFSSDSHLFGAAAPRQTALQMARGRRLHKTFHDADVVLVPLNHNSHWTLLMVQPKILGPDGDGPYALWLNSMIGCGTDEIPAAAAARVAADVTSEAYLKFAQLKRADPLVDRMSKLRDVRTASDFVQQNDVFNCGIYIIAAAAGFVFQQGVLDERSIDVRNLNAVRKRIFVDCLLGYCR